MDPRSGNGISFGEFNVDVRRRALFRENEIVPLKAKSFDLLLALIERSGEVVSKNELLDRVWEGQFVEENNLTVHIAALRKALGETKGEHKFIVTVPGKGYSFVGDLQTSPDGDVVIESREIRRIAVEEAVEELSGDPTPAAERKLLPPPLGSSFWMIAGAGLLLLSIASIAWFYFRIGQVESAQIETIAVMPFTFDGADPESEYLSDGITETLINNISTLPGLTVKARNSVFRYKGKQIEPQRVAGELNVQALLLGSVTERRGGYSLSMELVDARTGNHIWGENYDRQSSDLAMLQSDIARDVAKKLRMRLSSDSQFAAGHTTNAEAYQLYLKGRFFWNRGNKEGYDRAIGFFQQAIEVDPNYAQAYAGLADTYNLLGSYGYWRLSESHPKARAAAEKALELNGELAEAHASLAAVIADYYWDWKAADYHFKRAVELNPNYPVAHYWFSQQHSRMGRSEEAVEEARRALTLDPLSTSAMTHIGLALFRARRYDESVAELQRALEFDPNAIDAHLFLGFVYAQQGKSEATVIEFQTVAELSGRNESFLPLLGYAYAVAGKRGEAEAILKEISRTSRSGSGSPFGIALIYIGLREFDVAFEWLGKALNERAWQLGFLKVDPFYDPIRSDPRYLELVRHLALP